MTAVLPGARKQFETSSFARAEEKRESVMLTLENNFSMLFESVFVFCDLFILSEVFSFHSFLLFENCIV